jgi:hypothetical protein
MIINPYRFTSAGGIAEPIHWWDLDAITSSRVTDLGTKTDSDGWDLLRTKAGITIDATETIGTTSRSVSVFDSSSSCFEYSTSAAGKNIAWDGDNTDAMSVACWVKLTAITSVGNFLMTWYAGGTDKMFQLLTLNNTATDHWYADIYEASGDTIVSRDTAELFGSTGTWYHIAMTFDGTTLTLWLDGAVLASNTNVDVNSFNTTAAMPFAIGNASNSKNSTVLCHNGKMAFCGIWDVDIGSAGVAELYNSGESASHSELWG